MWDLARFALFWFGPIVGVLLILGTFWLFGLTFVVLPRALAQRIGATRAN